MATLFNTRIFETYQGLIKTIDNAVINATLKELTDGSGNQTGLYINTGGDFKVTNVLEWGSLKDTGTGVIVTRYVTSTDGIENFDNNTSLPTTAAVKLYVDTKFATSDTLQEVLSFGNTTSGNDIVVSASDDITFTDSSKAIFGTSQDLEVNHDGFDSFITDLGTGNLRLRSDDSVRIQASTGGNTLGTFTKGAGVDLYFNNVKKFETTNTGLSVTGIISNLTNPVAAQDAATKSYVDALDAGSDLDITDGTTAGAVNLNTQSLSILGTTNEIDSVVSGQSVTIGLPTSISTNLVGDVTGNLTGNVAGNVAGNLTGTVNSTSILADGVTATTQASSDDSTKVATTAYVKGLDNASDLDFSGDSGTGDVNLNTQTFAITGTTNQIESTASNQGLSLKFPTAGVTLPDGSIATTQSALDNSTKVATTSYVDTSAALYLPLAGGIMSGNTIHNNSVKSLYGSLSDAEIYHDGSNFYLNNSTGQFNIDQGAITESIAFRVSNSTALDTTALTINRYGDLLTGRDVTISGDLTVNGTTTTVNSQTLSVVDPLIQLAKANTANSLDIGFYGDYNDSTDRFLGLFSDASDGNKFKLFKGLTVEPTTTVNIAGSGYVAGDLELAALEATTGDFSGNVNVNANLIVTTTTPISGQPNGSHVIAKIDSSAFGDGGGLEIHTGDSNGDEPAILHTNYLDAEAFRLTSLGDIVSTRGATFVGNVTTTTFLGDLNGTINTLTTAVTQSASNNSTKVATTAYVDSQAGLYLPLIGGTLTGNLIGTNATFSGNVGIGVAADSVYALDIQGTSGLALRFYSGTTFKSGIAAVTTAGEMIAGSAVDDFAIRANAGSMLFATGGNAERMRIDDIGAVLIGGEPKIDGATKLQVAGSDSGVTTIWSNADDVVIQNNNNVGISLATPNTGVGSIGFADTESVNAGYIQYNHADNYLRFGTQATEHLRIDIDGQVQVRNQGGGGADLLLYNTDTSIGLNQMIGRLGFYKSDASGSGVGVSSSIQVRSESATGGSSYMTFNTDNGTPEQERMRITGSGLVGINEDDPSSRLSIGGNAISTLKPTVVIADTNNGASLTLRGQSPILYFDATAAGVPKILMDGQGIEFKTGTLDAQGDVRLKINSSGNVGIGVDTVSHKLEVRQETASHQIVAINRAASDTAALYLGNDSNNNAIISHNNSSLIFGKEQNNVFTERFSISDSLAKFVGTSYQLKFTTDDGSTQLGKFYDDAGFTVEGKINNNLILRSLGNTTQEGIKFQNQTGGVLSTHMFIEKDGNVTIGNGDTGLTFAKLCLSGDPYVVTSSGQARGGIDVRSNVNPGSGLYTGGISFGGISTGRAAISAYQGSSDGDRQGLAFFTHGSGTGSADAAERMRITDGGEFGFGTSSDTVINGSVYIKAVDTTNTVIKVGHKTGSVSGADFIAFYYNNSQIGGIAQNGTSQVLFNTSSDYRLKEDLQDFAGLDMVSKIPVYDFKWKTDESRSYGVMAHELQEVLPDAVSGDKDAEEMQSVDYSKIVPLLVKSIQELKAEVDLLKQECKCKN